MSVTQGNNTLLGQPTVTLSPWKNPYYIVSGNLSGQASIGSPSAPYKSSVYGNYEWCQPQTNTNTTTNQGICAIVLYVPHASSLYIWLVYDLR